MTPTMSTSQRRPALSPNPGRVSRASRNLAIALLGSFLALIAVLPLTAQEPDPLSRQVTLFGVIATPGGNEVDPKLVKVQTQLRKLLPGHSFRLLDVQGKRLNAGEKVACNLEDGFTAAARLVEPLDENGKVQIRCFVLQKEAVVLETLVTTPPNQLFFCEKTLTNGSRLLIGVGAR